MLVPSFTLQNGTMITPFLIPSWIGTYLHKKNNVLLSTLQKIFENRCKGSSARKNTRCRDPISSVITETTKLQAKNSGYQRVDQSRHIVRRYTVTKRHLPLLKVKLFMNLDHVNNSLFQNQIAKEQIKHKEKIIVGFFILQKARILILELSTSCELYFVR